MLLQQQIKYQIIMGAQQTRRQQTFFNPVTQGYQMIKSETGAATWINRQTRQELEEHQFLANNAQQFRYEIDAFNFRHHSPYLVSGEYLRQETQTELCGTIHVGDLFLERIPMRLSDMKQIPFPDVLHLYSQAFKGFTILVGQVGPFDVNEDMIGVNRAGIVKVWVNADFAKSLPQRSFEISRITEQQMVRKIIQVINSNTYSPTLPGNILEFFEQRNPLTLAAAYSVLEEYAALHRVIIPVRLDCYLESQSNNLGFGTVVNKVNTSIVHPVGPVHSVSPIITTPPIVGAVRPSTISKTHISRPTTVYPQTIVTQPSTIIQPQQTTILSQQIPKVNVSTIRANSVHVPTPVIQPQIVKPLTAQVRQVNSSVIHGSSLPPVQSGKIIDTRSKYLSPQILPHQNYKQSLFPRVNANPIRRATIPSNVKQSTHQVGRSRQLNFNPINTQSILGAKVLTSGQKSLTANTYNASKPFTFYPSSANKVQAKVQTVSSNLGSQDYSSKIQKIDYTSSIGKTDYKTSYDVKPLASTQIYSQNKYTTGVESHGIRDRISRLNNKYKTGSLITEGAKVSSLNDNTSKTYVSSHAPISTNYNTNINTSNYKNDYKPLAGAPYSLAEITKSYPLITSPTSVTETITEKYTTAGDNYKASGYILDGTPSSFVNIITEETREVSYGPGEAIQSFAVERFAANPSYQPTFARTQFDTFNISDPSYVRSTYIPTEVTTWSASKIPTYSPYEFTVGSNIIESNKQLYESSQLPSNAFGYSTSFNDSYKIETGGIGGSVFQSQFKQVSSPSGMAYISDKGLYQGSQSISQPVTTYQQQTYYRQQYSSTTFNQNGTSGDYNARLDADLMQDLEKIRQSIPL